MTPSSVMPSKTISIDPIGARDLDDAIQVERQDNGWVMDVLIPDVPSLVRRGDSVDVDARKQGLTTYSATGIRQSMLPAEIVRKLSLSFARKTPVIHVQLHFSNDLHAQVTQIKRGMGRTQAALTYNEADRALSDRDHVYHPAIAGLWDLTARLAENRASAIGADFDSSGETWLDEEGSLVVAGKQRAHRSNIIVMEAMIAVNSALAQHARDRGLPVIYRNHVLEGFAKGDRTSAACELAQRERVGIHTAARRLKGMANLVRQAEMGVEPLGHYGLNAEAYSWFTSPLRRYADIVSLRALLGDEVEDDLQEIASRLTGIHRSQMDSSSEYHGKMSRRTIISELAKGDEKALREKKLHIIIRALRENPEFNLQAALHHIGRRMAEDDLSGRDIAALVDNARNLLSEEAEATILAWVSSDKSRSILLDEFRSVKVQQATDPDDKTDHKGLLYTLARAKASVVTFANADRSGPPHNPVFSATVTWKDEAGTQQTKGISRTKKGAEQAAAKEMIALIGGDMPDKIKSERIGEAPPKTALLEQAAAAGANVQFEKPEMQGPPHAPTFSVRVKYRLKDFELHADGKGSSKREAERNASQILLDLIARKET